MCEDLTVALADELPLAPGDLRMNVAVHAGDAYLGQIVTGGRLEVSGLGEEVNACARVLQTARDGELLVSKAVLERLSAEDAGALGVEPQRLRRRPAATRGRCWSCRCRPAEPGGRLGGCG